MGSSLASLNSLAGLGSNICDINNQVVKSRKRGEVKLGCSALSCKHGEVMRNRCPRLKLVLEDPMN